MQTLKRCFGCLFVLAALLLLSCGGDDNGDFDAGRVRPRVDAGRARDAGPGDAGPGDAGPGDAGPGDAGPSDAGPGDAGPRDAGPGDAGLGDAGVVARGFVRFVHISSAVDAVNIEVDDAPFFNNLDSGNATIYLPLAVGQHEIVFRAPGGAAAASRVVTTVVEDQLISVVLSGRSATQVVIRTDDEANIPAGTTRLRLMHVASTTTQPTILSIEGWSLGLPARLSAAASLTVELDTTPARVTVDDDDDAVVDRVFTIPPVATNTLVNLYLTEAGDGTGILLVDTRSDASLQRVDREPICAPPSHAGSVPLASTMEGAGRVSEFDLTGAFAQIDRGDGSTGDGDGLYLVANPDMKLGTNVDLFPRESAFVVGSLSFDASSVTGCGIETVPIRDVNLDELWGGDISPSALGLWLFDLDMSMSFGALDSDDTLTFAGGTLTAINLDLTAALNIDFSQAGMPIAYSGSFSASDDALSLQIDETKTKIQSVAGELPQSRIAVDLTGTIDAL